MRRIWIGGALAAALVGLFLALPPAGHGPRPPDPSGPVAPNESAPPIVPPPEETAPDFPADTPVEVEEVLLIFRDAVRNPHPQTVLQARGRLNEMGDTPVPSIQWLSRNDLDPRVRANCVSLLVYRDQPDLADYFRERLSDESEFVRESALIGLARLSLWDDLRAVLATDPSERVRNRARNELARSP